MLLKILIVVTQNSYTTTVLIGFLYKVLYQLLYKALLKILIVVSRILVETIIQQLLYRLAKQTLIPPSILYKVIQKIHIFYIIFGRNFYTTTVLQASYTKSYTNYYTSCY